MVVGGGRILVLSLGFGGRNGNAQTSPLKDEMVNNMNKIIIIQV